jgi:hypothetical protein
MAAGTGALPRGLRRSEALSGDPELSQIGGPGCHPPPTTECRAGIEWWEGQSGNGGHFPTRRSPAAQGWDNRRDGRTAGPPLERTLGDCGVGPPGGVPRTCRRPGGPCLGGVGIDPVGPGHRGGRQARRRLGHPGGGALVPAPASRTTARVLVDALHAHPRHGPRSLVCPSVLTVPPATAAVAVRHWATGTIRPGRPDAGGGRLPVER